MGILNNIFGSSTKDESTVNLLKKGAAIIDVRSPGEFQGGHVAGAKNIPLNELKARVGELKKLKKPLVLCCLSGGRSAQATNFLKSEGLECENAGGWTKLNAIVNNMSHE